MSKIKIFITSVPLTTGVTEYDTDELLLDLPKDLKPIDREPQITINTDEVFFMWHCQKKSINTIVIRSNLNGNKFLIESNGF